MQPKKRNLALNKKLFAERFRNFRLNKGLSQRDLAKKIAIKGHTQISKFETGASEPSLETLRAIAKEFKIDLHEFITNEDSPATIKYKKQLKTLSIGYVYTILDDINNTVNVIDRLNNMENLSEDWRLMLKVANNHLLELEEKHKDILDTVAKIADIEAKK